MVRLMFGSLVVLLGCQCFAMGMNKPEGFFTDQPMEVARLIQEDQPARIPEAAKRFETSALVELGALRLHGVRP